MLKSPTGDSDGRGDERIALTADPLLVAGGVIANKPSGPAVWLVYVIVAVVQLMFSVWHVLGKVALNSGVNPLVFALYRELAALPVLLAMSRAFDKRFVVIERADVPRFVLIGACSFGNVVGFVVALSFTTAPNASILQPSVPVWVALLCAVAGIERLTVLKSVGVLLAVAGAAIVVVFDVAGLSGTNARDMIIGNIILIVQCFSMASILVLQKPLLAKYPPTACTLWYYSFGAMLTVLASLYYADRPSEWLFPDWRSGLALAYAVVVATSIAYSLISWAVKFVPSSTVSCFYPLQPFFTTVLSVAFLNDSMNLEQGAGAALIVAGLFCTLWKANAPTPAPAASAADAGTDVPNVVSASGEPGYQVLTPTPANPSANPSAQ